MPLTRLVLETATFMTNLLCVGMVVSADGLGRPPCWDGKTGAAGGLGSAEGRGDAFHLRAAAERDGAQRREEIRVGHAGTEIGPAIGLTLHFEGLARPALGE